jgi:hypothetical protein
VTFCLEPASSSSTLRTASKFTPFTCKNNQRIQSTSIKHFHMWHSERRQKDNRNVLVSCRMWQTTNSVHEHKLGHFSHLLYRFRAYSFKTSHPWK